MSNTVQKIRDVESFINVLETANAQGMHVKLGLFGRSLVVTPLPMKNGVPQDKRISQDQAAVARKLNQLVHFLAAHKEDKIMVYLLTVSVGALDHKLNVC
jgi:hypothetical protein